MIDPEELLNKNKISKSHIGQHIEQKQSGMDNTAQDKSGLHFKDYRNKDLDTSIDKGGSFDQNGQTSGKQDNLLENS